jgi:hypothetical protein
MFKLISMGYDIHNTNCLKDQFERDPITSTNNIHILVILTSQ